MWLSLTPPQRPEAKLLPIDPYTKARVSSENRPSPASTAGFTTSLDTNRWLNLRNPFSRGGDKTWTVAPKLTPPGTGVNTNTPSQQHAEPTSTTSSYRELPSSPSNTKNTMSTTPHATRTVMTPTKCNTVAACRRADESSPARPYRRQQPPTDLQSAILHPTCSPDAKPSSHPRSPSGTDMPNATVIPQNHLFGRARTTRCLIALSYTHQPKSRGRIETRVRRKRHSPSPLFSHPSLFLPASLPFSHHPHILTSPGGRSTRRHHV